MNTEQALIQRSNSKCELCSANHSLSVYKIPPESNSSPEQAVLLCEHCLNQMQTTAELDINHWRCLNDSMWSPLPAVQVMAWRQLKRLSAESWAQDLLDMMYLEDDVKQWAEADNDSDNSDNDVVTLDSNGAVLVAGDTVTLIKDLVVKGAGFTAKRGTAVRNIGLTNDPSQIEGRVNGTRIVLLTKFLKKSN